MARPCFSLKYSSALAITPGIEAFLPVPPGLKPGRWERPSTRLIPSSLPMSIGALGSKFGLNR